MARRRDDGSGCSPRCTTKGISAMRSSSSVAWRGMNMSSNAGLLRRSTASELPNDKAAGCAASSNSGHIGNGIASQTSVLISRLHGHSFRLRLFQPSKIRPLGDAFLRYRDPHVRSPYLSGFCRPTRLEVWRSPNTDVATQSQAEKSRLMVTDILSLP